MKKKLFRKVLVFGLMLVFVTTSILADSVANNCKAINRFSNDGENITAAIVNRMENDILNPLVLNVDDDCDIYVGPGEAYEEIQDAIDAAVSGQTICVYPWEGHYVENIWIDKTLKIRGIEVEGNMPVIDGSKKGLHFNNAVTITADHCNFSGFRVINAYEDGIKIDGAAAHHNNIYGNVIESSQHGGIIVNSSSHNNTIFDNDLTDIGLEKRIDGFVFDGIWILNRARDNKIYNNNIDTTTGHGIDIGGGREDKIGGVGYCHNNSIIGNRVTNTDHDGITVEDNSKRNTVVNNVITNCGVGDWKKDGSGIDIGYHCTYNIISNNRVEKTLNRPAISLGEACNNIVSFNDINNNSYDGLHLFHDSCNNEIFNNNITNNHGYGICVESDACNNTFYRNHIGYNFLENAWDFNTGCNHWNSTEKMWYDCTGDCGPCCFNYTGNWWSDYNGTDSDGNCRGELPYVIKGTRGELNKDCHPIGLFLPCYIEFLLPMEDEYCYYAGDTPYVWKFNYNWIISLFPFPIRVKIKCVEDSGWDVQKPYGDNVEIFMALWDNDAKRLGDFESRGKMEKDNHPYWEYLWEGGPVGAVVILIRAKVTNGEDWTIVEGEQGLWHHFYPTPYFI